MKEFGSKAYADLLDRQDYLMITAFKPVSYTHLADEIKNAIHFIEEQTGETFDWDAFFASMKRFKKESQHAKEWLEISRTPYTQVIGDNLALYRYGCLLYTSTGGATARDHQAESTP